MKKKIISLMMAMVMTAALTGCKTQNGTTPSSSNAPVSETQLPTETGTADHTTSGEDLIVATEPGFAPYEYMDGSEVVGIDMDIAKAIADKMGRNLVIKTMDFDGALVALQQGKVDFVAAGVSIQPDREKAMDFSKEYVNSTEVVVVNKKNPMVKDIEDLNDKIIGVQQGNIADFWISGGENVKAKEVKRYKKFVQASEDLKNGKIDCIVMDQYPAEGLVASNADSLEILDGVLFEDKYAIAIKKGNQEMVDQVNAVIDELIANGKIEEFTQNHTQK